MSARDEILARIRTALADRPEPAPVRRDYRGAGASGASDTWGADLDLFAERVADYKAAVVRCGESELPAVLARQVGDRTVVAPDGFPLSWLAELTRPPVADDPRLSPSALDELDGVLTTVAIAIAETGTIVLDAGPGQGRRALTLVPDFHCAVVRAEQVVASVPDAVAALAVDAPLTWISGPSSTSDIELSRVEGVHGPRQLTIVLLG